MTSNSLENYIWSFGDEIFLVMKCFFNRVYTTNQIPPNFEKRDSVVAFMIFTVISYKQIVCIVVLLKRKS